MAIKHKASGLRFTCLIQVSRCCLVRIQLHPAPPSPLCTQSRYQSFPTLLQLALVSLSSRIKPLLEMRLEALEHFFLNVFDVGEPVPTNE
jgi:hypothetical protein